MLEWHKDAHGKNHVSPWMAPLVSERPMPETYDCILIFCGQLPLSFMEIIHSHLHIFHKLDLPLLLHVLLQLQNTSTTISMEQFKMFSSWEYSGPVSMPQPQHTPHWTPHLLPCLQVCCNGPLQPTTPNNQPGHQMRSWPTTAF